MEGRPWNTWWQRVIYLWSIGQQWVFILILCSWRFHCSGLWVLSCGQSYYCYGLLECKMYHNFVECNFKSIHLADRYRQFHVMWFEFVPRQWNNGCFKSYIKILTTNKNTHVCRWEGNFTYPSLGGLLDSNRRLASRRL